VLLAIIKVILFNVVCFICIGDIPSGFSAIVFHN
jgi:hypothetical protein